MLKKIFSILLALAFLVNLNAPAFSYDVVQHDTLRSRASSGTDVSDQLVYSIKASSSGLKDRHTVDGMADQISVFFDDAIGDIRAAITINDDSAAQGYVNEHNAKKSINIIEHSPKGIQAAPMHFIEDLQDDVAAIEALKNGKLCLQMPFAGAGSRMSNSLKKEGIEIGDKSGQIPEKDLKLANINIWQIAIAMGKKRYSQHIKDGKTPIEAKRLVEEEGLILRKPLYAQDIGFAERHMLALEQGILNLDVSSADKEKISKNLKLIVSVSDDIRDNIMSLFNANSRLTGEPFFNLNPSNVVFVEGGYGAAYKIDRNNKIIPTGNKVSWNHGFAFEELAWITSSDNPGEYRVYTLEDGKPQPIDEGVSAFDYVLQERAEFSVIHRINDLMLLHPDMAIDIEMFGAFLNFKTTPKGKDANVFLEMMTNPTKQKGGMALTTDKIHLVLFEGLNTRDDLVGKELDRIAEEKLRETNGKMGVPYNRLYGFYEIRPIVKALTLNGGMPLSVNYKNEEISPEIPTGDITLLYDKGIKAYAAQRHNDRFIDEGLATDQLLNQDNRPIEGEKAYSRDDAGKGSGAVIHDCKEAKYIWSGKQLLDALDNPDFELPDGRKEPFFTERYYRLQNLISQLYDVPVNLTLYTSADKDIDSTTGFALETVTGTDLSGVDIVEMYNNARDCMYLSDIIINEIATKLIEKNIESDPDFISVSVTAAGGTKHIKTVKVYSREDMLVQAVYRTGDNKKQVAPDLYSDIQTSEKTSSSGISLTKADPYGIQIAAEIINLSDATGTIVFNDENISNDQKNALKELLGIGTDTLNSLQERMGCTIVLKSELNLSAIDVDELIKQNKLIIISDTQLAQYPDSKYLIFDQKIKLDNSYIPIIHMIAMAKGLLSLNNSNQVDLINAISNLSRYVSGLPLAASVIETYIAEGIFNLELPKPEAYDLEMLENLYRQTILALVAA